MRKTGDEVKATGVGLRGMGGEKLPTAVTGGPFKGSVCEGKQQALVG